MKRIVLTSAAGLLVAVPAAMGLVGNTSFAQNVPVRVPPQATVVDDHGGLSPASSADQRDDHGGPRPTSTTEPGDEHGGQRSSGSTSRSGTGAGSGSQTPGGTSGVSGPRDTTGTNAVSGKDGGSFSGNTGGHGRNGSSASNPDGPRHT